MRDSIFFGQAQLVLRILPEIQVEKIFALKGGTAINFFVRDLPRLSVDIDLTYLPINDRVTALLNIHEALLRIAGKLEKRYAGLKVFQKSSAETNLLTGLIAFSGDATVKIEPNTVMRGQVFSDEMRPLSKQAVELFETEMVIRTLSFEDLYGGKICAALDRQHPRDLFDIYLLLRGEGITEKTRKAFIVYLLCHPRPILDLLNPSAVDIRRAYEKEFSGMVRETVSWEMLEETRRSLIHEIASGLTNDEREFIISIKQMSPKWELLGLADIEHLPALKWKLINIERMRPDKHKKALHMLTRFLSS